MPETVGSLGGFGLTILWMHNSPRLLAGNSNHKRGTRLEL